MATENYAVLIAGGEPGDFFGKYQKRTWADMGQQVSFFESLGLVYAALLQELGADKIIVIASIRQVCDWLELCADRGYPPCDLCDETACRLYYRVTEENLDDKKKMWGERLAGVRQSCAAILASGGPDYDGEMVNAATVCNVLRGQSVPGGSGRVLPAVGVNSVFVWVTSHGGHHAVSVGQQTDSSHTNKCLCPPTDPICTRPIPVDPGDRKCDVCGEAHTVQDHVYSHGHSSLQTREGYATPTSAPINLLQPTVAPNLRQLLLPQSTPTGLLQPASNLLLLPPLTCLMLSS